MKLEPLSFRPGIHKNLMTYAALNGYTLPANARKAEELSLKIASDPNFPEFWSYLGSYENKNDPEKYYDLAVNIACTSDIETDQLVLFSTRKNNMESARQFVESNNRADYILSTPCGLMLDWLRISDTKNPLYDSELSHICMYASSFRLAIQTRGKNVIAFINGAVPTSTFSMIETYALQQNANVETVNDRDVEEFISEWKSPLFFKWLSELVKCGQAEPSPLVTRFHVAANGNLPKINPSARKRLMLKFCEKVFTAAITASEKTLWTREEQKPTCCAG
jgi:hypothetical protein